MVITSAAISRKESMINVTYSTRNVFLQDGTYVTYCASVKSLIKAALGAKYVPKFTMSSDSTICGGNVVWPKCEEGSVE